MRTKTDSQLLSRNQVAEMFGVSTRTIARWEERDLLHPIRVTSRLLRYRREDIEALIRDLGDAPGDLPA